MKRELLYLKNLTVEDENGGRLEDVSLLLREGECICMASTVQQKETLVRYFQGKGRKCSGEVEICGRRLEQDGKKAFEKQKVFVVGRNEPYMTNLTVGENVFLLRRNSLKKILLNEKAVESQADYYFQKFGIPLKAKTSAGLSGRDKSLAAMIRCISQGAKVLVLCDFSGLFSSTEIEMMRAMIRRLKEEGVGILISDNNPEYFYPVSDEVIIFKHRRIAKKIYDPEDFPLGEQIILRGTEPFVRGERKMAGSRMDGSSQPAVRISGQTAAGKNYELQAEKGEILLVSLPAVQMEQLWESLFGRTPKLPLYEVDGKAVSWKSVDGLVRQGVAFGYGGAEGSGVIGTLSAEDNILLPSLRRISGKLGFYRREAEYIFRDNFLLEDREKLEDLERDALKLMMYRLKLQHPKVLILNNVFTTADLKERDWLRRMVTAVAGRGTAVILLENERGLCSAFADRVERGEQWE